MTRRRRAGRSGGFIDHRVDRDLRWVVVAFLALITSIVGYNAHAMAGQRGAALVINVTARQRSLAERYIKDVLLVTSGSQADPREDARQLRDNADALLSGGDVPAVQGADATVHIGAVHDRLVAAKLHEERRLLGRLTVAGNALMGMAASDPSFPGQVLSLRVVGAQLSSISNDAVGQMTHDAEASFARLVVVGIALGFLGALAALAMGLTLRRVGARQSAKFRSLVQSASDLITVIDRSGWVVFQSPSITGVLGMRPEAVMGRPYPHLADADGAARLHAALERAAGGTTGTETVRYRLRHQDGSYRDVESIVTNLLDDPLIRGFVLNTRDVTERKRLEEELSHQAFHDSLTGLANRALFRDRVDHALARSTRQGEGVALLLLDLDGFKMVNDSLGHDAGDDLLVAVASRLRTCFRESDTVARLGGDEFAILLEDQRHEEQAVRVAERILTALAAPHSIRGRSVAISGSIGIAVHLDSGAETDELVRNADTAMYAAKGRGGARWEPFRQDMHQRAVERLEVQGDLQGALARGELTLHYQPIVDLATGAIEGTEALLRWRHPTRGLVMPNDFIPIAEETGLMVPIGHWVLREACRQTVAWRAEHVGPSDLWVSVNLSPRQLVERGLVGKVRAVLDEVGMEPSSLVLEITEGALMTDLHETAGRLDELKALGVRLAIDDFGAGSSSLGYLRRFPVDVIKIDKSFVDGLSETGEDATAVVEAIVELARTFHMGTVAEGIEMPEQRDGLQTAGCRSGQGYLFARPLTADAVEAYARRAVPAASMS